MKKNYIITIFGILLLGILPFFFSINSLLSSGGKETGLVSAQEKPDAAPPASSSDAGGKPLDNKEIPEFEIPPDMQKLIKVKTVEAAMKPLRKKIRTVGRIEFDERKLTTVNIKYEGWIEELHADYSGKYVKKGEPLAEIWSPELTSVQLEYLNLLKWTQAQVPRFQRVIEFDWGDRYGTVGKFVTYDTELLLSVAKQKFKLWGFTDKEITEIEERQEPFERITIRSPVSGYIYQKPVFKGTRVSPGDKIFDIVDLSTVWVLADFYEYELPLLEIGQPARITLSNFPGKTINSKVDFIYPSLSGRTRTVKARFVVLNPNMVLKPQMFTNVEIDVELGERLTIPREAFLDTGLRQIVYVDKGEGYFQRKEVKLGLRGDEGVEVLEGIKAGERVVARPVFLIDSEAKLKGISQ